MKKTYSKQFFFDSNQKDYILIKWTQGFSSFEIYHNDKKVKSLKGSSLIMKGLYINYEKSSVIWIRMLTKPLGFEVKSGDRYLFNSRILSKEKLKAVSTIFYALAGLISAGGILFVSGGIKTDNYTSLLWGAIFIIIGFCFIYSANKIKKGSFIFYFVAAIPFTIVIALHLLNTAFSVDGFSTKQILIEISPLVLIYSNLKHIINLNKHRIALNNYAKKQN